MAELMTRRQRHAMGYLIQLNRVDGCASATAIADAAGVYVDHRQGRDQYLYAQRALGRQIAASLVRRGFVDAFWFDGRRAYKVRPEVIRALREMAQK